MLIPHLHFKGNCKEAILLYEKAFNVKADSVILNSDYAPVECKDDDRIAHLLFNLVINSVCNEGLWLMKVRRNNYAHTTKYNRP